MKSLLRHARHNGVAYVALFLALSMGTAWAIGKNSVRSKNIVNGQVKGKDLAKNSVKSKNIVNGQVKAADLDSLVPREAELVSITGPSSSTDKSFDAECPSGKVAFSGGGAIEGGEGFVALTESRPVNPPGVPYLGWRVSAIEVNGGTADSWSVTVWANCARVG